MLTPAQKALATRRSKIDGPATKELAVEYAMSRGAKCTECPLYSRGEGPAPSMPQDTEVYRDSTIVSIGEAPGVAEIAEGRPFCGAAGEVYDLSLSRAGLKRDAGRVSSTTATLCRPFEDKGDMRLFLQRLGREHSRKQREHTRVWLKANPGKKAKHAPKLPKPLTPQQCCAPRLKTDIEESGAAVVLALGKQALEAVGKIYNIPVGKGQKEVKGELRLASIMDQMGHPVELPDGKVLWTSLHPSAAMHGSPDIAHVIRDVIERAGKAAVRIKAGGVKIDWSMPKDLYVPKLETKPRDVLTRFETWVANYFRAGSPVLTCDIETDGIKWDSKIRCVGLGYEDADGEHVFVVPLRYKSGKVYWPGSMRRRVFMVLKAVLNGGPTGSAWCAKIKPALTSVQTSKVNFHNGFFDTRHLARVGLWEDKLPNGKPRPWLDTLLMHKNSHECSLPHRLAFVSARFLEVVLWKGDVDHKASDNIEADYDLWVYNADDVVVQMRLYDPLMRWMEKDETKPQLIQDYRLAPIARNMGDLGMPIHEATRRKQGAELKWLIRGELSGLRRIVGRADFNPNSPQQVADWLYLHKGYDPVITPQGDAWEEGDAMSTSIPAMMALQDQIPQEADPELWRFIDNQIKYKSYAKLFNGYIKPWGELPWHPADPDNLRILHAQFKLTIASGRMASSPNVQNIPKLSRVNLRRCIRALPGYVLVGADLDQAELRAFAVATGNEMMIEAVLAGKDPHALNAAMMAANNEKELQFLYEKIVAFKKSDDKKKQTWANNVRLSAKVFCFACIAEGQEVLTKRGLVPIEFVKGCDQVWDGVEWVDHDGVIYKGKQTVITWDGLTATPDHKVWVRDGRKIPFGEASAQRLRLAVTGEGGRPVRFVADQGRGVPRERAPQGRLRMRLRVAKDRLLGQFGFGKVDPVQGVQVSLRGTQVAAKAGSGRQTKMHRRRLPTMGGLRRKGNRISFQVCEGMRRVSNVFAGLCPRSLPGSDQQRRPLRAGQPSMGGCAYSYGESPPLPTSKEVAVYDILNAGPRHRFTCQNLLVSNCQYGASADTLRKHMATARDKATGERMFQDYDRGDNAGQNQKAYDTFHKWNPNCRRWHAHIDEKTAFEGKISDMYGFRFRHFPGGLGTPNEPRNHRIQSTIATNMNRGTVEASEGIPHRGWSKYSGLMVQVHDELTSHVQRSDALRAARIIQEALTSKLGPLDLTCEPEVTEIWTGPQVVDIPETWA